MGQKRSRKLHCNRSLFFECDNIKYVVDMHVDFWVGDGSAISVYQMRHMDNHPRVTWSSSNVPPNLKHAVCLWFSSDVNMELQEFINKIQP